MRASAGLLVLQVVLLTSGPCLLVSSMIMSDLAHNHLLPCVIC